MDDDASYSISVTGTPEPVEAQALLLRAAAEAALRRLNVRGADLGVALVDDELMAELNARFLGHAGPTDVLTFDLRGTDALPGGGAREAVEGEIVISLDTAAREAAARGHTVEQETALYVVHGVLHLMGFDDREEGEAERMHVMEDEILSSLGLGNVYRSEAAP